MVTKRSGHRACGHGRPPPRARSSAAGSEAAPKFAKHRGTYLQTSGPQCQPLPRRSSGERLSLNSMGSRCQAQRAYMPAAAAVRPGVPVSPAVLTVRGAQFSSSWRAPSFINRVVDGAGPYRAAASAAPRSLFRSHSQGFFRNIERFCRRPGQVMGAPRLPRNSKAAPLRRRCSGRRPSPARHASIRRPAEASSLPRRHFGPASSGPAPDHPFGTASGIAASRVAYRDRRVTGFRERARLPVAPAAALRDGSNNCPRIGSRIGCRPLAGAARCLFAFGESTPMSS